MLCDAHALLGLLVAASCARTLPPMPFEEEPEQTSHAPAPFRTEQIRASMATGTHLRIRNTTPDGVTVADWEVLENDDEGCTIRYLIEDGEGGHVKGPTDQRRSWGELRDHASFPADATTLADDTVTVPAGTWEAIRYTVERERDGNVVVDTFWFAPQLPGPPLRLESVVDGAEVFRMELLLRETRADDDSPPPTPD